MMAIVTCLIGLQFGHVIVHFKVSSFKVYLSHQVLLQKKENATLEDIRQVLIEMGEAFLGITRSQIESLRMCISEARRYPQISQIYVESQIAPIEAQVKEFLDYYVAVGLLEIQDTQLAANAFFGMLFNSVFVQSLMYSPDYLKRPTNQMVAQIVNIFLNGVKKSQ